MSLTDVAVLTPLRLSHAFWKIMWYSWLRLRWTPSSRNWLLKLDQAIRSKIENENSAKLVEVTRGEETHSIWTVEVESNASNTTPLVLVHGMMGGSGMFINNINYIAKQRKVILLDLPGFGLSCRPDLRVKRVDGWKREETTVDDIEDFYTEVLELWCQKMGLSKFILLGHSYGGYLCSLFSLRYPDRVSHLILADPWGYPMKPPGADTNRQHQRSRVFRLVGKLLSKMNAFTPIRALGPLGPTVLRKVRGDLNRKFVDYFEDNTVIDYLYACNTWDTPSGETGFGRLSIPIAWAKSPLVHRVSEWKADLPVTFIYGARSWMDKNPAYVIKNERDGSYVDIQVIDGAGHHVYADRPEPFNDLVGKICESVDNHCLPTLSQKVLQRHKAAAERRRTSSICEASLKKQQLDERHVKSSSNLMNLSTEQASSSGMTFQSESRKTVYKEETKQL